jgi:hypothetical protein
MNRRLLAPIALSLTLLGAVACGASTPPAAEASTARRPGDAYVEYVAEIGNAGVLKELYPYLSTAARKRTGDLETLKAKVPGGVLKILDEQIAGDKATVTLSATIQDKGGKEHPAAGTVVMVREDGGWKVDQESWAAK